MRRGFFRRYFEDYTEERLPGGDGRLRTKRAYRGFYYAPELSQIRRAMRAVGYSLSYLAALAGFVWVGTLRAACNAAWYVAPAMGISLASAAVLAIPLFGCAFGAKRQTVYQYRSGSISCIRWSLITAGGMGLTALLALVACVLAGESVLPAGGYLLAACAMALPGWAERKVTYAREHNPEA